MVYAQFQVWAGDATAVGKAQHHFSLARALAQGKEAAVLSGAGSPQQSLLKNKWRGGKDQIHGISKYSTNHQETYLLWLWWPQRDFRQGFYTAKINSFTSSVLSILEMQLKMSQMVRVAWKPSRCQLTIFLGAGMLHGHTTTSPAISLKNKWSQKSTRE